MAVDWSSPATTIELRAIYEACVLFLLGVACWEVLTSASFDIGILTRRRKWRWPMGLYFLNRLSMVLYLLVYVIHMQATTPVNCRSLVWISELTGFFTAYLSTTVLALRTAAVWQHDRRVVVPLGILSLGQIILWAPTLRGVKSVWNPSIHACQIQSTVSPPLIVATWTYTMVFDFIILFICASRLWRLRGHGGTLSSLLLRDGIGYFAVTFTINLVATILGGLELNPVLTVLTLPFTVVISVIASTTVFRNVFLLHGSFSSSPGKHDPTIGEQNATFGISAARSRAYRASESRMPRDHLPLQQLRTITETVHVVEVLRVVEVGLKRDADDSSYPISHRRTEDDQSSILEVDDKPAAA